MTFENAITLYESIKTENIKTTDRLNEIAEILSCVYMQNEELANDMWQYWVEKYSDMTNQRFYVIRMFKALPLDYDLSYKFLIMNKKRVEVMFNAAYTSTNISLRASQIIYAYLKCDQLDAAVDMIGLLRHYEKKLTLFDGVKLITIKITDAIADAYETVTQSILAFLEKFDYVYQ